MRRVQRWWNGPTVGIDICFSIALSLEACIFFMAVAALLRHAKPCIAFCG